MKRKLFEKITLNFYMDGTWNCLGLLSKEHKFTPSKDNPNYKPFMAWQKVSRIIEKYLLLEFKKDS